MIIDIIIPVYKGLEETKRCIESVMASTHPQSARVIVIDDASPDGALSSYLQDLTLERRITVQHNARNLGFVATANHGLRMHPDRDVVLLNSDTRVASGWLERLASAAYASRNIGTVTPFSNNATICSYPYEGWSGGLPGTLGLERLDALFAKVNHGELVDLPTAVGFCMYIRRECIDRVGLFDEENFGRGYGEENDFCMRASEQGWRNVLAADLFVFHEGSVSFGEERHVLMADSWTALLRKHPSYLARVQDFIARDPVAAYRARVDEARCSLGAAEAEHVAIEARKKL